MSSLIGSATGLGKERIPSGYSKGAINNLSPDQQQLFSSLISGSNQGAQGNISQLSQLAAGGSPEMWQQLEAPALRQFGQLQGNIASRFGGGSAGGLRSSGFRNAQSGAATDLAERLQGQRLSLQQGASDRLMQLYQQLIGTKTQDKFLYEKGPSSWEKLMGIATPLLGAGVGAFAGGPMGAALGANLGSSIGGAFSGGGGGQADYSGIGNLPTKWRQ